MCEAYFDTFEQMTPHFFSDDDPLTLPLRCASGAGVEDCAPETLRQYYFVARGL
jgi:hypothetical protein